MSGLAGDIGIDNTGHTYCATNGVTICRWGLTDDNSSILAAGRGSGWYGDGKRYLGSGIWGDGTGRSVYSNPVYHLGKIGYSGEIGLVVLADDTIWSNAGRKVEIGSRARGVCHIDSAVVHFTRSKRDELAHRRNSKSILFHRVIIS